MPSTGRSGAPTHSLSIGARDNLHTPTILEHVIQRLRMEDGKFRIDGLNLLAH
jgi:hypothetical protein